MICDEDCNFSVYSDSSEEDRLYYEDLEVTTEAPQKSCNAKMLGFLRYLNIEGCDFLAELPDFSGASNLEEVSVAHCKNLRRVYDTSGYHANLRALTARGCTKLISFLEDGINFPSLEVLDLTGCTSLAHVSGSSLLSQILQVPRNRKFILPGGRVPEWIHCFNSGSSVSLRVRNKFPEIAVCVVFDVKGRGSTFFEFGIRVLINGTHSFVVKTDVLDIESGHVYLFDCQRQEFELKRELLGNKFNDVRISCNIHYINGSSDAYSYVKYIGVYVYNFGSCADCIQFESPRRTLEDMICDEDCNFSV